MKLRYLLLLTVLAGITGCSHESKTDTLGRKDIAEINRSITDGSTTVPSLVALYDKPKISKTPGGRVVLNWYGKRNALMYQEVTVLSVLSDNNIVKKHNAFKYRTNTHKINNSDDFVVKLSDEQLKALLVPGKTNLREITNKYGHPIDIGFDDDGNRVFYFIYSEVSNSPYSWIPNVGGFIQAAVGSEKVKVTVLSITTDDNDNVVSYSRELSNFKKNYGLLNSSEMEED